MVPMHQQKLLARWHSLNGQAPPGTQDEALTRVIEVLHHAIDDFRILFYLKEVPPDIQPQKLLPCSARLLAPGAFVYEATRGEGYFIFKSKQFYHLPLSLNSHHFGYLFLESAALPLDKPTTMLLALLATQLAQDLADLGYPEHPSPRRPESLGPLKIEPACRRVWIDGKPLYVSDDEFIFLALLSQSYEQGQPCSRELLRQVIYLADASLSGKREDRLDYLVFRLRNKLQDKGCQSLEIETVRCVGYQLRFSPSSEHS